MRPIPVLGIPHYNRPDLLARCIASIDYPVDKLVIVYQGKEHHIDCRDGAFVGAPDCVKETILISHPNAGVAGAWNEIITLFPAPYWMISNNDIQFAPGDLKRMHEAVVFNVRAFECPTCKVAASPEELLKTKWSGFCLHCNPTGERDGDMSIAMKKIDPAILYGNHGASWFAITELAVKTAGLFDFNIFPAYLEDCDYSHRCDLLGLRRMDVPGVAAIHGCEPHGQIGALTGSCTVNSDPALREKNGRTHGRNFDYYIAKWGGRNGAEIFKTPFNNKHWPVWAVRFDPAFRARQQW